MTYKNLNNICLDSIIQLLKINENIYNKYKY